MPPPKQPTLPSLLQTLTKDRLIALGRDCQVGLSPQVTKAQQIETLERSNQLRFPDLLTHLGRDELRAACRAHDLDDSGRARQALTTRLLEAHGEEIAEPASANASGWSSGELRHTPQVGDVVHARQRQYLVEAVVPSASGNGRRSQTRVDLVCLDDDNQGRGLSVLWELELGARVLQAEK